MAIERQLALDGVVIDNLQLKLFVRAVSALSYGFVDGQGGSYFDLPITAG